MARKASRPEPTRTEHLHPGPTDCPTCGQPMLTGVARLILHVRRCHCPDCPRRLAPYRPEQEGRYALPQQEFGLHVVALVGTLRSAEHRSVPEIHQRLTERGLLIGARTVTNLLERSDELLAVTRTDHRRRSGRRAEQGRVLLARDGLPPDVGHAVLGVLRDGLSGEVLWARSLRAGRQQALAGLLSQVQDNLPVPSAGVVSEGQHALRKAVAQALPGVPHQLGPFHSLRAAARPLDEADRPATKERKKRVRGVRPLEREREGRTDPEAEVVRGYGDAVRSALTDAGRPPLEASGLKLHEQLRGSTASLERVAEQRGCRGNGNG